MVGESLALDILHQLLSALAEKSLLRRAATGRYDLHEAVRQYAAGRLAEKPELASVTLAQHARYYADLIAKQNGNLKSSGQALALEVIHQEIENTRCAWGWLIENRCAIEISRCADSIFHYFNIRSRFAEGIELFQQAVQALEGDESGLLAF